MRHLQPQPRWSGVFPAVTTQFKKDQTLDLKAQARHIEALIDSGVSGLILCGSLGENQTLRPEEKLAVVSQAVKASHGRVPVLSGVAESGTQSAIDYVKAVGRAGAQGVMLMPPMLYRGDRAETLAFFKAVAKSTRLPIMIYNNPISYFNDVTPEMFAELARIPNFVALKESTGNTRRITDIKKLVGDRFALFTGVDDLLLESAILGIDGWVAGTGIAFPRENQRLWDLTREGRWDEARRLYEWFSPLLHLDVHTKFVQYIKLAMQECGLGREWVRAPRLALAGEERDSVLRVIHDGIRNRPKATRSRA
ncbi:MAG: dihydrodipicolinate synthase family protein [Verrucomicrobia bacterium]|nr:dihydrodipicolinate synthase family protein [Verrucomicrobiota bacterium]MBI3870243.1 dihydrodipicolinate synthase family protein [Verrucomicrobiota bacterium]